MTLPLPTCDESSVSELRAETRTHLFLAAMLSAGTVPTSVHIRNLSAASALIEGSALPNVGALVLIHRGGLSVKGVLAWKSKNQAGIAFKSHIIVSEWLPPQSGSRQCAIDRMVFDAKNGTGVATEPPRLDCALTDSNVALVELTFLRNDLVTLGDTLVRDLILVATHPEIQVLDIAVQRIDRLMSLAAESGRSIKI